MPTCKTFEKEMLLPHVLGGAGHGEEIRGGADQKNKQKKNNSSNASTSTTAIWDDTNKTKDDSAQHIISYHDWIL